LQRLILVGGGVVVACGLFCAVTSSLALLVGARFIQGLFVPALTTCLAAYLSTNLPLERLNVVMGSYVSATVAGGLAGRLLGGWIHPPLHWRYAFVTASILVLAATLAASSGCARKTAQRERCAGKDFWPCCLSRSCDAHFKWPSGDFLFFLPFSITCLFISIGRRLMPPPNSSLCCTWLTSSEYLPDQWQASSATASAGVPWYWGRWFALAIGLTLIKSILAIVVGAGLRRFSPFTPRPQAL
jgi:MFS family permease